LFFLAESTIQISGTLLRFMGRDATLTQRTEIWQAIREHPVDPTIGTGYMMYWALHKGIESTEHEFDVKTAHNGYLETYLDGGVIGLCFLAVMLLAVGGRVIREFLTGSEFGRLAFVFFVVMLLYNVSESIYARRSPLWFAFLLFALEWRSCVRSPVSQQATDPNDLWIKDREILRVGSA
jgi:O-antigen ligase